MELFECINTEASNRNARSANKLKSISKITEIIPINKILKPFLGLVENLIYQK